MCYICSERYQTPSFLIRHFKLRHVITVGDRYKCKQESCVFEFQDSYAFKKHLVKKHSQTVEKNHIPISKKQFIPSFPVLNIKSQETSSNESLLLPDDVTITPTQLKTVVKNSAVNFLAKLHNHNSIPRSVVQTIVDYTQDFHETGYLELLKEKVLNIFEKDSTSEKDIQDIKIMFNICQNPFEDLNTEYKRLKFFKSTGYFIEPQPYVIGQTEVSKLENSVTVKVPKNVEGQFISVREILKRFLELPGFLDVVLNYITCLYDSDSNFMFNIVQGKLWTNIKSKYQDKIIIPLIVNYDDYEAQNPLGSHAGIQKLGATYLVLPTLPPQFQSSLKNIFLTLLFYERDREQFGNRACFRSLLKELIELETNGIVINNKRIFFLLLTHNRR